MTRTNAGLWAEAGSTDEAQALADEFADLVEELKG